MGALQVNLPVLWVDISLLFVTCRRCRYCGAGDGGYPWDYCAASLMITEAGGSVYDINGDAYNVDGRSILATATPELRADILRAVQIA